MPFLSKSPFNCVTNKNERSRDHGSFQSREKQGLYRHEQSPPAKQGTDLKGKGLAFSNAFTSGKLGLCPFSLFYHRKINAQFSSIFFIRSCSFLATCILRLLANIIISLLTRRQRGTIASIIPKKLNPHKINER